MSFQVIEGGKIDGEVATFSHGPEYITILTCFKNLKLTKTIYQNPDNTWGIVAYGKPRKYSASVSKIDTLADLAKMLLWLTKKVNSCIVLGKPMEGRWTTGIQNLRRVKERGDKGEATLESRKIKWLPIDVDTVKLDKPNSEYSIDELDEIILNRLPEPLCNTSHVLYLSSSHGRPNTKFIKARLWFELEDPVDIELIAGWAQDFKKQFSIDGSIYQPHQPIYTASPIFYEKQSNTRLSDPYEGERLKMYNASHDTFKLVGRKKDKTKGTKDKVPALLKVASDDIDVYGIIQKMGLEPEELDQNKYVITCPWEHEHSDPDQDRQTSTVIYYNEDGSWGFHCMHETCQNNNRKFHDVLDLMVEQGHVDQKQLVSEFDQFVDLGKQPNKKNAQEVYKNTYESLTYAELKTFPHIQIMENKDGEEIIRLQNSTPNLRRLFKLYGINATSNLITNQHTVWIGGKEVDEKHRAESAKNAFSEILFENKASNKDSVPMTWAQKGYMENGLVELGHENSHNPVLDYLFSLEEYDPDTEPDYFNDLVTSGCIKTENDALFVDMFKPILVQAVAAADYARYAIENLETGAVSKFETVLVLKGSQGIGKSTFLRNLLPSSLQCHFSGNETIEYGDKDNLMKTVKYWIVELGEMGKTFDKSAIDHLKQFLSKETDEYRAPYASNLVAYPRTTVFIATVNESEFLMDTTGNRRFWPIEVTKLDPNPQNRINIDRLWAQAVYLYKSGMQWWAEPDLSRKLLGMQEKYRVKEGLERMIFEHYDVYGAYEHSQLRPMTCSEILADITGRKNHREVTRLGYILTRLASDPDVNIQVAAKSGNRKTYYMPPENMWIDEQKSPTSNNIDDLLGEEGADDDIF